MLIKKVKLKNIRSYVKQEIDFPKGSILLNGNIGSGKTTVLLAIEFALFGLQRGIIDGAALLRNGEDKGSVELEIKINGKKIKLKRNLKRKKDSIVQDNAILEIDGKEKELSATELKAFVLNTLNYPPQLLKKQNLIYRYTIYTPQEQMKYILMSRANERLDIIGKIFNIDKYKRIIDSCDIFTSKLRELSKLKEGKISDLSFKRQELDKKKNNLENLDKEIEKITPRFEKIKKDIQEAKEKQKKIESEIEKFNILKQNLTKYDAEIKEKEKQSKEYESELKKVEKIVEELRKEVSQDVDMTFVGKKEQIEKEYDKKIEEERSYEKEISAFLAMKERYESDSKKISSLRICPVCKQQVDEEHRKKICEEISSELVKINEKIGEREKSLPELKKEIESLNKTLKNIAEKEKLFEILKVKNSTLKDRAQQKLDLSKRIIEIKNKIVALNDLRKKSHETSLKFEDIQKQKKILEDDLEEKLEIEKEIIKEKASFEKGKKDIENEIKELQEDILGKEKISKELEQISLFREWLSKQFILVMKQIEKQVMIKLNLEFNLLFKKWFSMLVEDALDARVDLDFTPFVEQSGYYISYEYLSGGERTALALAYRLALNQVINSMLSRISTKSILILDEPTEGFSSEQLDKMREVLREIKVEQLILVSHEAKMESFVENVILFVKEANETRVQQNI
jgi:exonuclease SbcC